MLPASYATPALGILALGGFLSCFFGYRLFRLVLGLYGFFLGAFITTQTMGAQNPSMWMLVIAAVAGGVVGAVLMVAAYFIGVGLIGAGLAALAMNAAFHAMNREAPTAVLVIGCVLGALGALSVVRWVVVFGTALAGSWTLIVAGSALAGSKAALHAASAGDVWILYPLDPQPDRWWMLPAWIVLTLAGAAIQLATTKKSGARKVSKK